VSRACRRDQGQASVELALVLPLVVFLLLTLVQGGLLVRDQILVTHAAREAARAAALDDDIAAMEAAATSAGPLHADRMQVDISGRHGAGSQFTVRVTYRAPTNVPLVGQLLGDFALHASASMRAER
jgi:Flp pilus assembly protein TadG